MKLSFSQCFLPVSSNADIVATSPNQLLMMCCLASLLDQLQKEQSQVKGANTGQLKYPRNTWVMLADDDGDDRELFEEVVSELSTAIQVRTAENGFQLMHILNETEEALPAVIFLDLNMPGKSGKECLKEIKKNPRLNDIPVVIYSTSINTRDIKETHDIGANLYVSKPNSFKGLIKVIDKVFSLDTEKLKLTPPLNQFVLSADVI